MKGTIFDFLKLTEENHELAKELVELAGRYDFEFATDQLSEADLDDVTGGTYLRWLSPQNIAEYGYSSEEVALTQGSPDGSVRISPMPPPPEPEPDAG